MIKEYEQTIFLIVGAMKAGTTALYKYLSEHPEISPARRKELHYFDWNFHLPRRWFFEQLGDGRVTGEASPFYLYHPWVPARIKQVVPKAKIIIVLRDPVERAISHYSHSYRMGEEELELVDALGNESLRLAGLSNREDFDAREGLGAQVGHSYMSRGKYWAQIDRYQRLFPAENLLIVKSEQLFDDECLVKQKILRFLGVDEDFATTSFPRANEGISLEVPQSVSRWLQDSYQQENHRLKQRLGVGWEWTEP